MICQREGTVKLNWMKWSEWVHKFASSPFYFSPLNFSLSLLLCLWAVVDWGEVHFTCQCRAEHIFLLKVKLKQMRYEHSGTHWLKLQGEKSGILNCPQRIKWRQFVNPTVKLCSIEATWTLSVLKKKEWLTEERERKATWGTRRRVKSSLFHSLRVGLTSISYTASKDTSRMGKGRGEENFLPILTFVRCRLKEEAETVTWHKSNGKEKQGQFCQSVHCWVIHSVIWY